MKLVLAALLCSFATVAVAQGTPQERAACRGDVIRFCGTHFGTDAVMAIGLCLHTNRPKLSKACAKVLAAHGL